LATPGQALCQRSEWLEELYRHQLELSRLRRELSVLREAALRFGASLAEEKRASRTMEYVAAQVIRHEISVALISSRLAIAG
jgi:hypothetical protein